MIEMTVSGSFDNIMGFLDRVSKIDILAIMDRSGQDGVNALIAGTPEDTGLAANSWGYETTIEGGVYTIEWTNSDVESGFPVAIMLQYGHGTGTGGYVQGIDYINPAMAPVFEKIADDIWKAVTSA